MDLLSFPFLHEICDAEMQGFQNLDESAVNQLGSFRFSLQVAALELSETWSCYHWTGEDWSHTLRLSHTILPGAMQKYDIEHSMCGGLALDSPMQLRIKIVYLKAALKSRAIHWSYCTKSQHSRSRTIHTLQTTNLRSIHIELVSKYDEEISGSGRKHQLQARRTSGSWAYTINGQSIHNHSHLTMWQIQSHGTL